MAREGQGYPCQRHDMMMMMISLNLACTFYFPDFYPFHFLYDWFLLSRLFLKGIQFLSLCALCTAIPNSSHAQFSLVCLLKYPCSCFFFTFIFSWFYNSCFLVLLHVIFIVFLVLFHSFFCCCNKYLLIFFFVYSYRVIVSTYTQSQY